MHAATDDQTSAVHCGQFIARSSDLLLFYIAQNTDIFPTLREHGSFILFYREYGNNLLSVCVPALG
jgi:hypothetical protein